MKTAQSTVATFEVNHEIGQGFNAFQRHGVIDGGAHAAYHTVTFQRMQTCGEGLFQKTLSVAVRQLERHVHAGTVGFRHIVTIEITLINDAVQQFCFLLIDLVHLRHAAVLLQPFKDRAGEIPQTSVGC